MEMEEEKVIPLLPVSKDKPYDEALSEALDNALTKVAQAVLNFDSLTEKEYNEAVELYLSYVATRYQFEENEVKYIIDEEIPKTKRAYVIKGTSTIFFSKRVMEKAEDVLSFVCLIETIEHEFAHLSENRKIIYNPHKKITNESGQFTEQICNSFYDYLKDKISLPEISGDKTALEWLQQLKYLTHKDEMFARNSSLIKLEEFDHKLNEVYSDNLQKELKRKGKKGKTKKENATPENVQCLKEYINKVTDFETFIQQDILQQPEMLHELEDAIREHYYNYCNDCIHGKLEIGDSEWKFLAMGMQIGCFYNQHMANLLYKKGLEAGSYEACLIILNAKDYPADIEKMKDIISQFKDDEYFLKDYHLLLDNFDEGVLFNLYNQVLEEGNVAGESKITEDTNLLEPIKGQQVLSQVTCKLSETDQGRDL